MLYLDDLYYTPPAERNFGVAFHPSPLHANLALAVAAPHILAAAKGIDVVLWPALFKVWPSYHWGVQQTGDCVSWGTAHLGDVNMAIAFLAGLIRKPDAMVATEPIYGFGKAELANSYRYNGAGMAGQDAVEAVTKYGSLYRRKYEADGNTIDLSAYDGGKARAWGERPGATHGVPDWLEPIAAEHKASKPVNVDTVETGAALLEAGYAWQYCGHTYWPTARTPEGFGAKFTSGAHCMTCVGVKYESGRPAWWRIANTGHGDHVSGPPEVPACGVRPPDVYQECGGWVPTHLVEPVLRAGDCYALTAVEGWPILDLTTFGFDSSILG